MTYDVDVTISRDQPSDVWPVRVVGRVGTESIEWDWWTWVERYRDDLVHRYRTFRESYV